MLAMALAFGLVLAGCDLGGEENTDPKKITITGLTGESGTVEIIIRTGAEFERVAEGEGTISNNSVTVSLKKEDGSDWTGAGSHYIMIETDDTVYLYTNGKTLSELGISSEDDLAKLPKYNITDATSTIAFSQFVVVGGSVPNDNSGGSGEDDNNTYTLADGTYLNQDHYEMDPHQIDEYIFILQGDSWTAKTDGKNYVKGTFTVSGRNISFYSTHQWRGEDEWELCTDYTPTGYLSGDNSFSLSTGNGFLWYFTGNYERQ
jgi:hypothetical protein